MGSEMCIRDSTRSVPRSSVTKLYFASEYLGQCPHCPYALGAYVGDVLCMSVCRLQGVCHADGAGSEHDNREFDVGASDAAEPLTKKRVAFKDELVDDAEVGNQLSVSPPTPLPHDARLYSASRDNRFGPRGRGVGASGRRPLAR